MLDVGIQSGLLGDLSSLGVVSALINLSLGQERDGVGESSCGLFIEAGKGVAEVVVPVITLAGVIESLMDPIEGSRGSQVGESITISTELLVAILLGHDLRQDICGIGVARLHGLFGAFSLASLFTVLAIRLLVVFLLISLFSSSSCLTFSLRSCGCFLISCCCFSGCGFFGRFTRNLRTLKSGTLEIYSKNIAQTKGGNNTYKE